jgi:hypothetical protein
MGVLIGLISSPILMVSTLVAPREISILRGVFWAQRSGGN